MQQIKKWGAVVFWMALIFVLSSQSQFPTPEQRWVDFVLEKSAHTFEFAVLGALLVRALGQGELKQWRAFGLAVLFAWLYALLDEFHQRFVPGRSADWMDVLFDWLGALIGTWLWLHGWRARKSKSLRKDI